MKIGIDIDGVLADFNEAYIRRCVQVTGKDLFPPRPFDIQTWNYPESYGYTDVEVAAVWASIKSDGAFWRSLKPYNTTAADIQQLAERAVWHGDDVYFITARPGITAKRQTEEWLRYHFAMTASPPMPGLTVLITSHKGLAAQTLSLDIYIDDRLENALDVSTTKTRSYLLNRSWNTGHDIAGTGLTRVFSITEMLDHAVPRSVPPLPAGQAI